MTLTMGSPKLRELTRPQLQSLAKREVVRAVGKTEDIIRRLMRKHPRGVPTPEDDDDPSASSAPPKRNVLKKSRKGTPSPVLGTSADRTDPKGKGKPATEAASPSPSSSTEALEQLLYFQDEPVAGPSNTNPESTSVPHKASKAISFSGELSPVPLSEHPSYQARNDNEDTHSGAPLSKASNPGWQTDEEDELDYIHDDVDYPKGAPNHYMVVDALRQFTTLVNTIPSMETRIAESQCLLQRTESLLEKATPDARELTVTREYLETFLLAKMKEKRELWDGTGKMQKEYRKVRMEWLRVERKAENEKRWREANKFNEKHGLKPVPFSAFASQSDEEVIESLQTTPASSRSGSSKRTREESAGGDSDADVDTDDENQRKRARS